MPRAGGWGWGWGWSWGWDLAPEAGAENRRAEGWEPGPEARARIQPSGALVIRPSVPQVSGHPAPEPAPEREREREP
ncbi:hypothetical protein [Streptomyces sp. NPDC002845]